MAIRKWWAGFLGPFLYDDAEPLLKFETAAGTTEIGSLFGQDADNVDINGGTLDGVTIGATTSALSISAEEFLLDGPTLPATILDAGTVAATEAGWLEVVIGGTTQYIRTFATK